MEDGKKTKKQLIEELNELRQCVAELKGFEEEVKQTRANQEKFTKAFLQNSIPVGITTLKEGRFIEVSDAYLRLMGRKRAEVVGHTSVEIGFITEDQRSTFFNELNNKGRVENLEMKVRTKGGALRDGLFNAVMMSLGNEKYLLTVMTDITERNLAEESLRERDIHFKKLSSWVPGMIYQFTKRPDGTYCVPFTTDAIKDIFGCSPQDVREDFSPIFRVILPEDLGKVIESIKYSAQHMAIWTCEYRVQIPGQSIRWMIGQSTPEKLADGSITWYGFNTDITERKQAEQELRKYHEALEELVNERTRELEEKNLTLNELNMALKVLLQQSDIKE